jgi:uncharacterized zinc-type alcohol dehydrogenase-like protein
MKTRGYAALESKALLTNFEFERRNLGEFDVGFNIKFSGICHSDIHQAREEWGPAIFPMVPGHEIVGIVSQVGSKVSKFRVGIASEWACLSIRAGNVETASEAWNIFAPKV